MKFAIALLATLVLCGSASILNRRPAHGTPKSQSEQEWHTAHPEMREPKIQERIFKDGGEYRYLYDGQILTGMPEINSQFSGARIRAVVKLQLGGGKDLMQIEKVFVGSLHERFVNDPQTLIQIDAFEPVPESDAPFEEVLKKPVQFQYQNGKITEFEVTEDEPSWSINIKRAILSTFHLSLTDRELPEDDTRRPDPSRNQVRGPKRGGNSDEPEEYFTVVEDGIGGRCEAKYLILQVPNTPEQEYPIYDTEATQNGKPMMPPTTSGSSSQVLNVTKTIDYRNCEFRPFVFKGLHFSAPCPHCENEPESFFDMLESAAHTRYNITGTKSEYIIDSAITEAVYKVTPRSHFAGSIVAYANITTILIASGPMTTPIAFPGAGNQIDGLHMVDAKFVKREGENVIFETPEASKPIIQKPQYWPNVANKPAKVKAIFEKLVQEMSKKEVHPDAANLIDELNRLIGYASEEELEQIYGQIKSVSGEGMEKEEVEHIFADILVSVGSRATFTFLKKVITEQKLKNPSALVDVLAMLPIKMDVDVVDSDLIEDMEELCKSGPVEQNPFVKRSCWLAYGTLVHKACHHHNFDARVAWKAVEGKYTGSPSTSTPTRRPTKGPSGTEEEPENMRCPPEFRDKVAQAAADKLKSTSDDEEKLLVIKKMGNMGLKQNLDELEQVAEDEQTPVYIRTQAIYAMRHIAPTHPEEVLEILMPLYRTPSNPTQVRIAAFVIILASKPELPALEDIAQSLNREVDEDVASYVYSSMTTLANSTDPCLKNVTRDIRLALETTTPINADWRHSKGIFKGGFAPQLKSGLFWEVNTVMDKDAPMMPRAANLRLHANVMHKSLDLLEVTFETEGMGEQLRKYVGNFSQDALVDILSGRAPRMPRAADVPIPGDVTEINGLLNIQPREPKEIRGTASFKIFGQETRFVVINPQTVSRFLVELMTQSSEVLPKLMSEGLKIDNRRATMLLKARLEFPTVLGVPITTSIRMPVFGGLKGSLKVQMTPKPQPGLEFFKSIPQKMTLESDVQTHIAGELHVKLSAYLGFLKVGAGIRTKMAINMPIDGKLELNLPERMSKWTMDMPENPIKLVKMESYPVTFVTKFSKQEKTYTPKTISPRPTHGTTPNHSGESEESMEQTGPRTGSPKPGHPGQTGPKYLHVKFQPIDTPMITPNGRVELKVLSGLPVPNVELWEIPTPDFVKSRQLNITLGHESIGYEINIDGTSEYPDTRLPTKWLPTLAAKKTLDIKLTPKKGIKKVTVTVFERSHFTLNAEKELLTKLQDKVQGIPVKDLSKPNTPKDYEKIPKLGHSLQILVNSEGNESPEAWTTRGLVAVMYSVGGRYLKTVAAMESKVPVLAKKMCMSAELRYPDRNNMWFITPQEPLNNKTVQGNMELYWGEECGGEKLVKMRWRIQKSEEQRDVEKQDLYDVSGVPVPEDVAHEVTEGDALFTSLWKNCQKDRQRGAFFSKECIEFAVKYTDLLRLKVDIEYKNVSAPIRKVLHLIESGMKTNMFWNTDVEDVDIKNPENKINAIIELSTDRSYLDITYKTPAQNVNVTNIDLPYNIQPVSVLLPWTPARLVGLVQPPVCTLTGPKIRTFDDVSDEQPLSGSCWHVLVKDNSPEDLFAVLVANVEKGSLAKKVAVLFKGHRIEIIPKNNQVPSGEGTSQPIGIKQYTVKHNGQELPDALTPEKRTTIPPNTPQDKQELADIMLIKPEMSGDKEPIVGILSKPTGLFIKFDGSSVTVEPSPFWKGGVVGLCGQYTGQGWDDLLLPNKKLVDTTEELAKAFMLPPQGGCDATIPRFEERPKTRQ